MKKAKASEWPNRALEVDVEYELRTSAPQEEMERYYQKRRWETAVKFNKNEMEKYYPPKLKISKNMRYQKNIVCYFITPVTMLYLDTMRVLREGRMWSK